MKNKNKMRSLKIGRTIFAVSLISIAMTLFLALGSSARAITTITWDGGGSTNNWSEPANWSGDVVPGAGDDVIFDAISTKNVTIDVNINVGSILISSGYSGTITQSDAASLTVAGCSGRTCFTQNGGTFNGSNNTITLNSNGFGSLTMNGGIFNGGSGDISLLGAPASNPSLLLLGGVFTSTSGNLTVAGNFTIQGAGTSFVHNNGTVTLSEGQNGALVNDSNQPTITFNNLNISVADGVDYGFFPRTIVQGDLALNDGSIGPNGGTIEARGGLSISPNFDGGQANLEIANGSSPRVIAFDTSFKLPRVIINDPNVTLNTSGAGTLNFPRSFSLLQGVVNQGSVDLVFGPRPGGGACFVQAGGVFNGSSNSFTANSNGFGSFNQSGGSFNAGSGDISMIGAAGDLTVSGGTFTSTSGTLTATASFRIQGGSYIHNGGTVNFIGSGSPSIDIGAIAAGVTFNNVNFNRDSSTSTFLFGKMITIGTLSLTDGGFTNNGIIEVRAGLNIVSTFDGGGPSNLLIANGSGPRTFTFDTSYTLPFVTLNDPNVTLNTSGAGTLNFPHAFSLQQGVFNQGDVALDFSPVSGGGSSYTQSGGTFNGGANTITFTAGGFGGFSQSGGSFNSGSGDIILNGSGSSFAVSGGTFVSTPGTLTAPSDFRIQGGSFIHNGGTVNFIGSGSPSIDISAIAAGVTFNNVNFNRDSATTTFLFGKMITIGTLSLIDGGFTNNGIIEVRAGLNIASTFDGGGPNNLLIANGSGPRSFTFDTSLTLPFVTLDDPNVTLNTSGSGTLNWPHGFRLQQGVFNQGNVDLDFFPVPGGSNTPYSQSGGTFNGSSNSFFATGNGFGGFSQSGGSFNAGSGDITLNGTASSFTLSGGTFISTSGTLTGSADLRILGGTFSHNNGTVTFTGGGSPTIDVSAFAAGVAFNNVSYDRNNGSGTFLFGNMITAGTLSLNDGGFTNNGTIEAQGNVNIASTFDGGGPNAFTFSGSANQTFTNNGGPNPPGTWTINKPSGTVTAASSLILGTSQPLNITSGTLYLNSGSDLTTGAITIGASGKLLNDTSTTITLGGNVSNGGAISLQGNGSGCPEADAILLRSSVNGTRRSWSGTGNFLISDTDVQDQGGTAAITVFSGTDSGNNGSNFTFTANCPTVLSISPASVGRVTGTTQTFTASGGFGTRTFSISVNNSGATINSATGLYTAGATPDVTDTVRVTDSLGSTADATVNVSGPANKLAFTVQPGSTTAGQILTPSVKVAVQDVNGVIVTSATNSITLSILHNPTGAFLFGTVTRNTVNGVANFDDLSINIAGTGYTISAQSTSLTSATSTSFDIAAASPSTLVIVVSPPPSVTINTPIAPPVQVAVRDSFGNTVPTANNQVTIGILNNPGGSTLSGTASVNAVNGVASFADLSLNNPGTGYRLQATSPSMNEGSSSFFDVISPFVVTNANDSGAGSLRQAITTANATTGAQTISFNIPGTAPFVIALAGQLPTISDPVVIDGTTQPGYAGTPLIRISGSNLFGLTNPIGLSVSSGSSTIRGLFLSGFRNTNGNGVGIQLDSLGGNSIEANIIGLDGIILGTGNGVGIQLNSSGNTVGGGTAAVRNIISGNLAGVVAGAPGNVIKGNFIGTDPTGTVGVSNDNGIFIGTANNTIGGNNPGEGNVISGNLTNGISLFSQNDSVLGNLIGTTATGTLALANGTGINASGASQCTISGNTISGNTNEGLILANGVNSSNNIIQNNLIGLNSAGSGTLGNGHSGIFIGDFGSGNRLTANRIFGNGFLGITLGSRGVGPSGPPLPNDPNDPDGGANFRQNYPDISSVTLSAGNTNIKGTLNSTPSTTFTLEFFSNPSCDASGNGEGETFLGTVNVATDISGNAPLNINIPVTVANTRFITATATDANGNTSEFSGCKGPQATIQGTVKTAGGQPILSTSVKLQDLTTGTTQFGTTDSTGGFSFKNLPLGRNYTVTPTKTNLVFSPPSTTHNNLSADQNDAFIGSVQTFTISGSVTLNSAALGGVTMSLSGGASAAVSTDSVGHYSFSNLPAGTYTVTPSLQNFSFSPASSTFTINSNQTANFAATNLLAALTGRIAFTSSGNIKAMNADGSGIVTVVPKTSSVTYKFPSISANGAKFAFIEQTLSTGIDSLILSNPDGSGIVNRASLGSSTTPHLVSWSPDGTKVATTRKQSGITQIVSVATATGTITPIVKTGVTNRDPDWSPDGTQLVFTRDDASTPTSSFAVFRVNADGTGLVKLTSPTLADFSPKWSPDGTKIAFLRSLSGVPTEVMLMNPNGTGVTDIYSVPISDSLTDVEWAPDGSRLAVIKNRISGPQLVSIIPNGTSELVIDPNTGGTSFDWGRNNISIAPPGRIIISLPPFPVAGTSANAVTPTVTVEPISPNSLGSPPSGFVFGSFAYQISTADLFTPPATVCIALPPESYPTSDSLNALSLLHLDGEVLVDITTSRDLAGRQICGQSVSLGSFVIAEQTNNALPRITGLVIDQNGLPISDIAISLTGNAEQFKSSDAEGAFSFVNLENGGNYLVSPVTEGYTFVAPFAGFVGLNGEQTVIFVATPATYGISGTVRDDNSQPIAGVAVSLSGAADVETTTDADGNYSFAGLTANAPFVVTPSADGFVFAPKQALTTSLQDNLSGVDFARFAPLSPIAALGGRALDPNGNGLSKVTVTLQGGQLTQPISVLTNPFGYFRFDDLPVGETYILSVSSKRFIFSIPIREVTLIDDVADADFVGSSP